MVEVTESVGDNKQKMELGLDVEDFSVADTLRIRSKQFKAVPKMDLANKTQLV